ncbi:SCO3242 family prenyltransferase [Streptomyces sp. ML-6]|uniref:SCO3242 family prenyltransferase n=1 Tax=Streptomyces sp. ML-6 TaxID=2982693 RepID=UPI0024C09371|nr:UbiA family prenyltransferase [Streptomyces sp. ML-6]MDK0524953.1 UbiA family prenyltransferase [Streptomyces sp. ML-6]
MNTALAAYAELVRAPAALTVPGDVVAGALAAGRPNALRTTALAASSVTLYWAGMALNDWADRTQDATERPHRPIPSGRLTPRAALATATALTGTGLGLAALAGGRRTLLHRTLPLAAAVWAYDLGLKHTPLGPATMAAARALDVLHATAPGRLPAALPAAATIAAHTYALTRLSRHETDGAPPGEPKLSLATTTAITTANTARLLTTPPAAKHPALVTATALAAYAATCTRAQSAAARTPCAPRVRTAVTTGIHALLPLQAALIARTGAPLLALPFVAALPLAGRLARKVSPT